jgi:quinohemoprotein amine dehydrogenase
MLAGLLLFLIGIPVTDPTVVAKCGTCHAVEANGNMQRLSFARTTPEGWQAVLKSMLRSGRLTLTQPDARVILKYLSDTHGLAPDESKPLMYEPERRVHDETATANQTLLNSCAKCHSLARVLSWRRSPDEWKEFAAEHSTRFKFKLTDEVLKQLAEAAPLDTPQWNAWAGRTHSPELTGRWLLTAHVQGKGKFYGEMVVTPGSNAGEYTTHVKLTSINDGSIIERDGRITVYAGYEWRGRSKGINSTASSPDDLSSDAREAMWFAPDGSKATGRWFWGQFQEFGFDVTLQRPAGSTLLALDISSVKIGSKSNRVRLIGDHFPDKVTTGDIAAGSGLTVHRIISNSPTEILLELDVSSAATPGLRDVTLASSKLPGAIAVYDRIDYIRVMPDSAMAAFPDSAHLRGFQQFEAIAYQRGPDGRLHTHDDLELGPVSAKWSMEVFYETDTSQHDLVGNISQAGFFTPAAKNPGINYDIWIVATVKEMTGKSYVVVTVPTYTFAGHTYVRDLDRWIEEP